MFANKIFETHPREGGWDTTKESMLTFDINYVAHHNNRSSYGNLILIVTGWSLVGRAMVSISWERSLEFGHRRVLFPETR